MYSIFLNSTKTNHHPISSVEPWQFLPVQLYQGCGIYWVHTMLYRRKSMVNFEMLSSERYLFPYEKWQAGLTPGWYIVATTPFSLEGNREPKSWCPPRPRLGTLWLHYEGGHFTCEMFFGSAVGHSIQAFGWLTVEITNSYIKCLRACCPLFEILLAPVWLIFSPFHPLLSSFSLNRQHT